MSNLDKVIECLQKAKMVIETWVPIFEQYNTPAGIDDAIKLLKKQEAVEPEWHDGTPFCGNCGHRLEKKNRHMDGINCPSCKQAVKWNENISIMETKHSDN